MNASWWALPGPSRFIEATLDDLRAGRSIVLALPSHTPRELRKVVEQRVEEDLQVFRWGALDLRDWSDLDKEPPRLLSQNWAPAERAGELLNSAWVAEEERLWSLIVWVEGLTEQSWPAWHRFLLDYETHCRDRDVMGRTLFILQLVGRVARADVPSTVTVRGRKWDGFVRRRDLGLYLDVSLRSPANSGLKEELEVAIIGELAGFDPQLALELSAMDLASLTEPTGLLERFGGFRGWNEARNAPPCWHEGSLATVEGRPFIHAGFLAVQGDPEREIGRRLWRAQIAVLFPYLEELRVLLVQANRKCFKVPFETDFGTIDDPLDLELPHVEYLLRRAGAPRRTVRIAGLLKRIRHQLAHLEPVTWQSLERICNLKPEELVSEGG